jgi:hypothetical protein
VTRIPFGLNLGEAIAVLLGAAFLVWAAAYYFLSLKPEQDRLRAIESELEAQQRSIIAIAKPAGQETSEGEDPAKTALETLETFKGTYLKPFSSGRIALIKEINALAKKNNVTLTSGIDMGASAGEPEGDQATEKKSASKRKNTEELLNAFPSVTFRFTVFGQYPNLRTFISEVEREKQFVVINSVNLTNQEARAVGKRSRGGEGTAGTAGIMLTIEMSAYYQPS